MSDKLRDSSWDKDGILEKILGKIELPKMAAVKQKFDSSCIKDIPSVVTAEFGKIGIGDSIKEGDNIAITVGSRGVANIPVITKAIVDNVKALGGKPFIVPAMGSHGGATAEGQQKVIEGMGVTEEFIGAPIRSSMEVVEVGRTSKNKPVYIDKNAHESDGIIVAGRIKPHTAFQGPHESGIYKMMTIGLGKQLGAEFCHSEGFGVMHENVPEIARVMLKNSPILFGVGIVENAFDNTCIIEALRPEEIDEKEPILLLKAKELMPEIKIHNFDILIIDQIGKNFSGDGMDPNITGTFCTPYVTGPMEIKRYVVLDLSEETHGNAIGMGKCSISTKRLFDKCDFDQGYVNCMTSTVVEPAFLPIIMKNDRMAISAAVHTAVGCNKENPKIIRIMNTSHIEKIYVSEALEEEVKNHPEMTILEEFAPFSFNENGNLF